MTKIFYDHLTITEEIITELDNYRIEKIEREEIIQLVDENVHHRVLDAILKKLPKEKHEEFLTKFSAAPGNIELLDYLRREITDIEELITREAKLVKKELLAEIKRSLK